MYTFRIECIRALECSSLKYHNYIYTIYNHVYSNLCVYPVIGSMHSIELNNNIPHNFLFNIFFFLSVIPYSVVHLTFAFVNIVVENIT